MSRAAVFAEPSTLRSQKAARNAMTAIRFAVAQAEFIGMLRLADSFRKDEARLRAYMVVMGWTTRGEM